MQLYIGYINFSPLEGRGRLSDMDIKEPYMNNYCDKCRNHYLLDGNESRYRAISLGMSSAMCVQVKECQKFKEKWRSNINE